jgi:hypothetical protein
VTACRSMYDFTSFTTRLGHASYRLHAGACITLLPLQVTSNAYYSMSDSTFFACNLSMYEGTYCACKLPAAVEKVGCHSMYVSMHEV